MKIKGNAWNYGDDINTDFILPGKYLELTDPKEMAKHAMEGIDPNFVKNVRKGDVIVGVRNMGLGSSREHAPIALKHAGIGAVIAKTFARIFYRNAFNVDLPAIECPDADKIKTGDKIEIDTDTGMITLNDKIKYEIKPLPEFMIDILNEGGLVPYLKNHIKEW